MMEIVSTKPGTASFELFEKLPALVYPADSPRHKQKESLNPEFLSGCYLLMSDGNAIGRYALFNNPYLNYDHHRAACIGYYECIDDAYAARMIFDHAFLATRDLGFKLLIGPMNGSTWENYRFSLDNTYPHFFQEPYHHSYYNQQFVHAGFKPIARYVSNKESQLVVNESANKRELYFTGDNVVIRPLDTNNYETELRKLFPFLTKAFERNFLYTPVTWEGFLKKYQDALPLIDPDFVLVAETKDQGTVGVVFSYTDHWNKDEKSLIVKTLAANKERKYAGLGLVLSNLVLKNAKKRGYGSTVHAFMLQNGTSSNISKKYSSQPIRTYLLYAKQL